MQVVVISIPSCKRLDKAGASLATTHRRLHHRKNRVGGRFDQATEVSSPDYEMLHQRHFGVTVH